MYHRICAALLLAASAILDSHGASADVLDKIKSRGRLICGALGSAPPLGFQDPQTRELVGYEVDLCKAVARELGTPVEMKIVSLPVRIAEILQGNIDIMVGGLSYSAERESQIDFSDSYYQARQVVFVRDDGTIKKLDDLAGRKVGAVVSTSPSRTIRVRVPTAQVVEFQDPPAAFLAFQQGKVEGVAISEGGALGFLGKASFPFGAMSQPLSIENYGIGMGKGEVNIRNAINRALSKVEASGEAQLIFDRWFGTSSPYKLVRDFKVGGPVK